MIPRLTGITALAAMLMAGLVLPARAGTLSCSITTAAACTSPSVIALRLSGASNAHAELPAQSTATYANNVMCCTGVTGLANTCTGTNATVAKLAAVTNSHIEQNTSANYANLACLSVPGGGTITMVYQATNCTGNDTTLGSMPASTNAHAGDTTAYSTKMCGTATASGPTLSFSISDTTIGFGTLSSSAARHATGDTTGSASEVEAHTLIANTTASSGYTITAQGDTLKSESFSVAAIGGTNTASVPTIEQFGLRATATGGTGTVTVPYEASGFAYAGTVSTPSQLASATTGTGVDTTYSMRYLANIAPQTESGTYTTSLVYVITANF
jgi:hypothetical protein